MLLFALPMREFRHILCIIMSIKWNALGLGFMEGSALVFRRPESLSGIQGYVIKADHVADYADSLDNLI